MSIRPIIAVFLPVLIALLSQIRTSADPLRFTSGSLSGTSAIMTIAGNTNLDCQLEQLNPTNDTWTATTSFLIGSSGSITLTNSLIQGYGYFRTKSTNGAYQSTNAFGAMALTLPTGYSIVGNPFATLFFTDIFPTPVGGTRVYRMTNGSLVSDLYVLGSWHGNNAILRGEGAIVYAPTNLPIQFYGTFDTNSFSRTLPADWSLLMSPLYHLQSYPGFQLDSLDSILPGGLTSLPVNTSTDPKSEIDIAIDTVPNYDDYILKTNSVWMLGTNVATVPITWGEGFWFRNLSTNTVTWTINSVPIW